MNFRWDNEKCCKQNQFCKIKNWKIEMSINPNLSMLLLEEISEAEWRGERLQVWKANVALPTLDRAARLESCAQPHCWIFGGWGSCAAGTWSSVVNDCWNVGCGRLGLLPFSLYKQGFPSFRNASHISPSSSSSPTSGSFFFLSPSFTFFTFSLLIYFILIIIIFLGSIGYYSFKGNLLVLMIGNYREVPVVSWGTRNIPWISPYGQWLLTLQETNFVRVKAYFTTIVRTYGWKYGQQQQHCSGNVKCCFRNTNHFCETISGCLENWSLHRSEFSTLARTRVHPIGHVRSCSCTYNFQTRLNHGYEASWWLDPCK